MGSLRRAQAVRLADFGRNWPPLARFWPLLAGVWPVLAGLGRFLASLCYLFDFRYLVRIFNISGRFFAILFILE
jgi:hypothetical protein